MATKKTEYQKLKSLIVKLDKKVDENLAKQSLDISEMLDEQDLGIDKMLNRRENKIIEKVELLLTKFRSDFYDKIDPILKEVIASREERLTTSEQISRNERGIERNSKRISKLQISV